MRQRHLGRSGLQISCLTLSTNAWGTAIDDDSAHALAETYLQAGGNTFLTGADEGTAEEALGSMLGDVAHRSEVVLIGRAGSEHPPHDTSRARLLQHLDDTLSRLRTDHLDLWLAPGWSDAVPLSETLSALEHAVTSGRARYVGVAGLTGWQLARAYSLMESARIPLVSLAAEYSLLRRDVEADAIPAAEHLGVGLLAGAPLGRGVLSGKYRHTVPADSRGATSPGRLEGYLDPAHRAVTEAVATAADGLGVKPTEVALRWVLGRPSVTGAVIGARTPAQLHTVLSCAESDLPAQVTEALDDVSS